MTDDSKGTKPGASPGAGRAQATPNVVRFDGELPMPGLPPALDDLAGNLDVPLVGDLLDFGDRDPFSIAYVEFLEDASRKSLAREVDHKLRDDLLEKPYLMTRPEDAGMRGAAAVWRSLRELMSEEGTKLIDGSSVEELELMKLELDRSKAVVDGLARSLDMVSRRLAQRLATARAADAGGARSDD